MFQTGWCYHLAEIEHPGGIAHAVDCIGGTFGMLDVDDELGRFGRVEDHAGILRALHLQTHEVIKGFRHAIAVGVPQEPDIATQVVAIGFVLDHIDIAEVV